MQSPKLRDSVKKINEPYPLEQIKPDVIEKISRKLLFEYYLGRKDLSGDAWGDIFADAIGGNHFQSPLGLADVAWGETCWSAKTIKDSSKAKGKSGAIIRLISGRCSPDYSYGLTDRHSDIQKTGTAVIGIWNARVDIAMSSFRFARNIVLIRDFSNLQFSIFESRLEYLNPDKFVWSVNSKGNFEGHDSNTGEHILTWQPHGSQLTLKKTIPSSQISFKINKPNLQYADIDKILDSIGYDSSWVTFN